MLPLLVAIPLFTVGQKRKKTKQKIAHLFVPVAGTEGCQAVDDSLWVSPKEVVCIGRNQAALEIVNATTGKTQRTVALPANTYISSNFGVSVAPNGKWILWPSGKYGAPTWSALSLDGKFLVTRPRLSDNISNLRVAWRPDSRGWAEVCEQFTPTGSKSGGLPLMTRQTTLRIYHLSSPKSDDVSVPQASAINGLQVTQKGEALIECSGPRLVVVSMVAPFPVKWEITPTPPANSGSSTIDISPRGDRIAWTFQKAGGNSVTESIWLSDIKGTKFEQVTPALPKDRDSLIYLHWTPDGKALSGWGNVRKDSAPRMVNQLIRIEIPACLTLKP